MPQIGIRQLKNETSEILRAVRDDKVEYVVTHHGRPVAVIRPVAVPAEDVEEILALAQSVYAGLDKATLAEVEAATRRRQDFFGDMLDGLRDVHS
jgi:prevent-host-death family protein